MRFIGALKLIFIVALASIVVIMLAHSIAIYKVTKDVANLEEDTNVLYSDLMRCVEMNSIEGDCSYDTIVKHRLTSLKERHNIIEKRINYLNAAWWHI